MGRWVGGCVPQDETVVVACNVFHSTTRLLRHATTKAHRVQDSASSELPAALSHRAASGSVSGYLGGSSYRPLPRINRMMHVEQRPAASALRAASALLPANPGRPATSAPRAPVPLPAASALRAALKPLLQRKLVVLVCASVNLLCTCTRWWSGVLMCVLACMS